MDPAKLKKYATIAVISFAAWYVFGRKKSDVVSAPVTGNGNGDGTTPNNFPGVERPGVFTKQKAQPTASSGTSYMTARQPVMSRKLATVMALRPTPVFIKAADIQRDLQTAFSRLTLTTTGTVAGEGGAV